MLRLLLIRHGESVADIEKRHEGRADFSLTERGEQQVEKLAEYLSKHYNITEIYCSPLKRAYSTALAIATKCDLQLIKENALMEINNGHLAGLKYEDAERLYPLPKDGLAIHKNLPGGESSLDFKCRIEKFWHEFFEKNNGENKTVCLVAHGGTVANLNRAILHLPNDTDIKIATGDTGFHEWLFTEKYRKLLKANCQQHLTQELL